LRVSRTGSYANIQFGIQEMDEPLKYLSDIELQENCEKQKLREFFHDEMVTKLGNRSGQILKMKE